MTVPAERLREGQQIFVRGKISFSRLAKLVDGPALAKSIEQAKKRGSLYPTTVPHTTINLIDAQVLAADGTTYTPEEEFVASQIYSVKSGENQGKQGYGIDNKSTYLPTILEPVTPTAEDPSTHRQLVLERDLATGVDVTLVLQVFKPKDYEKRGIGLQQVILNEAPRYFASGGVDSAALQARGIVVGGPIVSVPGESAPVDPATAAAEFTREAAMSGFPTHNTAVVGGYPVPVPGAQGVPPVVPQAPYVVPGAPVAQAPAAPVVQAPVVAPAPAVAAAPAAHQGQYPGESTEQYIQRLQAQVLETQNAAAHSGGASAFDGAAPVGAPAGAPSPWDVPGGGPQQFQG